VLILKSTGTAVKPYKEDRYLLYLLFPRPSSNIKVPIKSKLTFFCLSWYEYVSLTVIYKLVFSKTMTQFTFRRY